VAVVGLLQRLTGAEEALVVNNNAAAVLLALQALAAGREVVVSRGELIEIGGSFRIPDIMRSSGALLHEVGTTNKTHLTDYRAAVNERTALLLKVHTSNYRIVGFTESVPREALVQLGSASQLPVMEDLGSGNLVDLAAFGLEQEPTVSEVVRAGVDVVTFRGDKLLGGPQAGILVGKRRYLEMLKRHPLNRALRIDKMTLPLWKPPYATISTPMRRSERFRRCT
jgi:L-seryl-tRNA(Ser) seleniumtransferase